MEISLSANIVLYKLYILSTFIVNTLSYTDKNSKGRISSKLIKLLKQ